MVFKLNISQSGKSWKLEVEDDSIVGKSIGDRIEGKEISGELDGYELELTGGTDFAGFPLFKKAEGIGLKRVLLTKGWGMKDSRKGIRLRKTVRGKQISEKTIQINLIVTKKGKKELKEIFPDQNKNKEIAEDSTGEDNNIKESINSKKIETDEKNEKEINESDRDMNSNEKEGKEKFESKGNLNEKKEDIVEEKIKDKVENEEIIKVENSVEDKSK
jgi:small subunit ribosomal protein S6e